MLSTIKAVLWAPVQYWKKNTWENYVHLPIEGSNWGPTSTATQRHSSVTFNQIRGAIKYLGHLLPSFGSPTPWIMILVNVNGCSFLIPTCSRHYVDFLKGEILCIRKLRSEQGPVICFPKFKFFQLRPLWSGNSAGSWWWKVDFGQLVAETGAQRQATLTWTCSFDPDLGDFSSLRCDYGTSVFLLEDWTKYNRKASGSNGRNQIKNDQD